MKTLTSKKTVLIIDDEEELCLLMEMVLIRQHFIPISVHNLKDGISAVQEYKPDYIFLDNHLPDGMGITRIRDIIGFYPKTKIVVVSIRY